MIHCTQGSILSPILCAWYYGHIERTVLLPALREQGHTLSAGWMLARLMDDYLFVSSSPTMVGSLKKMLLDGRCGFSCHPDKTVVHLAESATDGMGDHGVSDMDDDCTSNRWQQLHWCGLDFDTASGEVTPEFPRYARHTVYPKSV